jgi:methylmalonyl-CoA mutase N-terminal domain/subunit
VTPPDLDPETGARIEEARRRWEDETLKPALARSPERAGPFATSSGAPLERLYTPADTAAVEYLRDLGFPGEFPYTRGVQPTAYRGRLWTMRQYAGFGSAAETNKRFRYLLAEGQSGLSVAFDLPTQMGYDADHAVARSEAGKVGVSISSLDDIQDLFEGIPLDRVSTSMTINATAAILLCLYVAVGERQGVPSTALSGTVQNDILKEYIARGTYVFPPAPSMRLVTDTFAFCRERVPRWNTISISGYHVREAGCTAAQEVAFTLANGIAYVAAAHEAGLQVDEFAPQLSFFFNAHNDLLEEVAKFRAARRLWGRIMRDRFGAKDPRSLTLRFHAQTAGSMLTAQQPENNVVRVTLQALAAVLGGCQSLHTNSMDEALSLPTEAAVRVALRTQQILAHESGVAGTIDPLGGSTSRGGGGGLHRQDRRPRRLRPRHRVHAAGDPGIRLPLSARGGVQGARRGRRQRVRHRRVAAARPLPGGCRAGRGARRAPGAAEGDARSRCRRPEPGGGRSRGARPGQPASRHPRRGQGARDAG